MNEFSRIDPSRPASSYSSPKSDTSKPSPIEGRISSGAQRSLGEMPLMGFGTFIGIENKKIDNVTERLKATEEAVFNALKVGYRHLDTAMGYGNLNAVGNAIRRALLPQTEGGLGLRREDLWITLKGNPTANIEASLRDLKLDYVDLYLIHHPVCFGSKEQLLRAWSDVNSLILQGKAGKIGVSNCYQNHLERLLSICKENDFTKPYANQIELHLFQQEGEFAEYCRQNDIKIIAYSPLGYGNVQFMLENEALNQVASNIQATPAQAALAYTLSRGIAVIPCSTSLDHMKENRVAQDIFRKISKDQKSQLAQSNMGMALTETSANFKDAANKIPWK